MIYIRYNPDNPHDETCSFVMFGGKQGFCHEPAFGQKGHYRNKNLSRPLCEEHFNYAKSLDGVTEYDVKNEKPIPKKGVQGG